MTTSNDTPVQNNSVENTAVQLTSDFANVSISWGTMRDIDLYEAFSGFLAEFDKVSLTAIKEEYSDIIEKMEEEGNGIGASYIEDSEFLIEALFDAMNNIAPENCYFGASEGDGSDYGFWSFPDDDFDGIYTEYEESEE